MKEVHCADPAPAPCSDMGTTIILIGGHTVHPIEIFVALLGEDEEFWRMTGAVHGLVCAQIIIMNISYPARLEPPALMQYLCY